jgi:tetratricopeptide (TPR) repeat protein
MTLKRIAFIVAFSGLLAMPHGVLAQAEPDDIGLATDEFQDSFYESLKQKGIENYDRAVTALEKCQKLQPNNPVVYFEFGKNYLAQKDYTKAYDAFDKAAQIDPKNRWYVVGMYDVCYETRNYTKAIEIVAKLVEFKKEYKEDLVSLYMYTQQFDKAHDLINEMNDNVGKSDKRDNYKAQILMDPKYQGPEKANLADQIKKNPKEESNYIALITLYSNSLQEDKAMEVAKQLEKEIPTSDWAQVSLFKMYLSNNQGDNAIKSMNTVFASSKIDNKIKHRMLNEFLIFSREKPEYDAALEKAIVYFKGDREVQVAKEVGKFYQVKNDWPRAIRYYELHLNSHPEDTETAILELDAYGKTSQSDLMAKRADVMIETFPLEPKFYYYSGLGHNGTGNFKKAKDMLEAGLDYIVENTELQIDMYQQLQKAYTGLGDPKKADEYLAKAGKLRQQKKQ